MSSLRPFVFIAIIATFALVMGCSGGGGPVAPENTGASSILPAIALTNAGGVIEGIGIMGTYELNLDFDTMEAEMVAKRTSAIGESFIVSGLGFFTQAPCADCLKMVGVDLETDMVGPKVKLTFSCSHPFKPGDVSKPPTAVNRLDLDVGDLALVLVPGEGATPDVYSIGDAFAGFCAYPDGHTNELSEVTGITAACPYYLVIDDTDTGTATNNMFAMGTEDAQFDVFIRGGGTFDMYLTMGYGASAKKMQRLNPKYYWPEFNRKMAWKVNVVTPENDPPVMGETWDDKDDATTFDVIVEAYDWQQDAGVSATVPYDDEEDTSLIYAASNVSEVELEMGLMSASASMTAADSGTGMPGDPLLYTFSVANEELQPMGQYYGLVKVTDERVPGTTTPEGGLTDTLVDSPDGIDLIWYNIDAGEFCTYLAFPYWVAQGCGPITGQIDVPATCPVTGVFDGGFVNFEASGTSANGGDPIVAVEWDADYDGVTFDVDATGSPANLGPFDNPNCGTPPEDPVTYTVACRLTDSCDPPNVTVVGTCDVTVDNCSAPVTPITEIPYEDPDDDWHDIGVMPDGYVYVAADVTSTGNNTNTTRTCIQFDNDGSNMTILNPGTGMCDVWGNGFTTAFNRVDVTEGGYVCNNPQQAGFAMWTVSGSTATDRLAGCWAVSCGSWVYGVTGMHDIWNQQATAVGQAGAGYEQITDCGSPYDACIWCPDSSTTINFAYGSPVYSTATAVKGVGALDGSNNIAALYDTGSQAYLSESGGWFTNGVSPASIQTTGAYGTDDGDFSGCLDVATDSNNNILTLEDHGGGTYRFQKFDSSFNWCWSSPWVGSGEARRLDYDKADDQLYLVTDENFWICTVADC